MRRASVAIVLLLAACGKQPDAHRFNTVVDSKPSPDGRAVAAQVWAERGAGSPHTSGIVVAARGAEPLDGEPVLIESDDFRPLFYRWTGPDALEVRLPCGGWSALTNHWRRPGASRDVAISYLPPEGCVERKASGSALPPKASQPAEVWMSPHSPTL